MYKTAGWLWNTINRWLKTSEKRLLGDVPEKVKFLSGIDLQGEMDWLQQRIEQENSPVVFCHNDMQEGNILLSEEDSPNNNSESDLVLIGKRAKELQN